VENASGGANAVIRSLKFNPGDKRLYLSIAYDMIKHSLEYVTSVNGESLIEVTITFPTNSSEIVNAVKQAIKQNTGNPIRFASFSHISSVPALLLPVKELIDLCRENNILVLIDGAHVMGHIPVNVTDLNPDFYLSNGHKWLYSPKGSAFLWVNPQSQSLIHPTVISGTAGSGFQPEFWWTGTRDYSAQLAMWSALDWREAVGGDQKIMSYMHNLAVWTGHTLSEMWNTNTLVGDDMTPAMTNVRLPTDDWSKASIVQNQLMFESNIFLVVYPLQNHIYTRISLQIFNEQSDIITLGNLVLQILGSL